MPKMKSAEKIEILSRALLSIRGYNDLSASDWRKLYPDESARIQKCYAQYGHPGITGALADISRDALKKVGVLK